MQTKDLIKRKRKLQYDLHNAIDDLVQEFEAETGLFIKDINVKFVPFQEIGTKDQKYALSTVQAETNFEEL